MNQNINVMHLFYIVLDIYISFTFTIYYITIKVIIKRNFILIAHFTDKMVYILNRNSLMVIELPRIISQVKSDIILNFLHV